MVMALDLAQLRADPHFAAFYEMTLREWFGDFLGELTTECHVDPIRSVDHILVGGLGPTFLYRSAVVTGLDRAQVTTCLSGVAAKARADGVSLHADPFDGGIELRAPDEPPLRLGFLDDRTVVIVREQGRSAERDVVTRTVRARAGDGATADAALMAAVDHAAAEGSAWLVLGGATVAAYGLPDGTSIRYVFRFGEHIQGRVVATGPKVPAGADARLAAEVERRLRVVAADPEMPIAVRREKIPGGVAVAFTLPPVVLGSLIDIAGRGGL